MTSRAFNRLSVDFKARIGFGAEQTLEGRSPELWIMKGAYDEDNLVPPRSLHHFFQPVYLEGLSVPATFCKEVGFRADQWALAPWTVTNNDHSLPEARQQYLRAVLGPNAAARANGARRLFEMLGHVVHLVQDMAQPEHTRNDQHLPGTEKFLGNGQEASVWEQWGNDHLNDAANSLIDFDSYPTVKLPNYASYFHTADTFAGRLAGKGMADFSNLNFVTQDTNYHDEDPSWQCSPDDSPEMKCLYHTEPRIEEAARRVLQDQHEMIMVDGKQEIAVVDEEVYTSFPRDYYLGTQDTDVFHTYHSSIDLEARAYGCRPLYSLGDGSYLSRAALLVPRAVGYSAGLIEQFFRGAIEVEWKNTSPGVYDMTIVNGSAEQLGADARIEAVYRATQQYFEGAQLNTDTGSILSGRISDHVPGFAGLAPGQRVTISNVAPAYLKEGHRITNFERRIAVEGTLGTEAGAVIGLVQAAEPGKIAVMVDCWSGGTCALPTVRFNSETGFMDWYKEKSNDWLEVPLAFGGFTQSCSFEDPLPAGTKILNIEVWVANMERRGANSTWTARMNGTSLGDQFAVNSAPYDCTFPYSVFGAFAFRSNEPTFYNPGAENTLTISGKLNYEFPQYVNWYDFNKARIEAAIIVITYE